MSDAFADELDALEAELDALGESEEEGEAEEVEKKAPKESKKRKAASIIVSAAPTAPEDLSEQGEGGPRYVKRQRQALHQEKAPRRREDGEDDIVEIYNVPAAPGPQQRAGAVGGAGPEATAEAKQVPPECVRAAAGRVWVDPSLEEWPKNDFRLWVGDLSPDVSNAVLSQAFSQYPSFAMARVVRDKRTFKPKFGFVSFLNVRDAGRALREMNGKFLGGRPITVRKGDHAQRTLAVQRKKNPSFYRSKHSSGKRK